ncbi:MAG: NAD(P)H-dependent oxidoreductase [Gammaproteobacteria bacterium]|nr:NAD(P)H-dependent oxidoreductase [Gammaproteobacteria bacterium]
MKHDLSICIITCSVSGSSVSRAASQQAREILSGLVQSLCFFDANESPSLRVDSQKIDGTSKEYLSLYDKVSLSDSILLCYPIYCYTASSTAKAITEILGPALYRKPVATIVAAGSLRSHLACGDLMLSMMFEQETLCFPKSVLVTEGDLENSGFTEEVTHRIDSLCRDFCDFSARLKGFSEKQHR